MEESILAQRNLNLYQNQINGKNIDRNRNNHIKKEI